ncbi:methyltransferase type 11 [Grosmannia clavigera kw1407]|uniref:Methyltransferase type 11 n=1 Tax=Grosmannia clavigera (strain kw1407 / UAMH 11150) TaxID=655863 RepID=F0XG89_GROCL|nr:methyltransferase type 11 [Grosmannia clavigera kw1407]EFX02935.1 methyltransferase type 11 [Grosmannia clavigera kw1407]
MTETTSVVEVHPGHYWTAQPLGDEDDSTRGDDASTSTASIASSILHYRTVNGRTYHSDAVTETKYCDFADLHPNVTVIGTDISPIQPAWVPPNVKFQIDDFTQPWTFAEESVDFIYARWLIGCVTNWTALFKEAYRTLKPGGWIETFESDGFFESDDGTLTDKNASSQWGHIFSEATKKHGSTASFTVVRDKVQQKSLREAGFVNIQENPIKCPFSEWPEDLKLKEIGLFTRAAWEADPEGFIGYMAHSLGWTKEEITVYCAHMRRELRGLKIHLFYRVNAVWAQKPFSPS